MGGGQQKKRRLLPLVSQQPKLSRKQARKVTTSFHKYSQQRDLAIKRGDQKALEECDRQIQEMGGIVQYQRASQVSTEFHSTSKWVLGVLRRRQWFSEKNMNNNIIKRGVNSNDKRDDERKRNKAHLRQQQQQQRSSVSKNNNSTTSVAVQLLEVGAINTELLDAAERSKRMTESNNHNNNKDDFFFRLHVRAIDIHSMHEGRIEAADFLTLPVVHDIHQRHHVVVCSMVINCVTTPEKRGLMLCRLFHFLRPGGLMFLTLPRTCLNLSPYISKQRFLDMLEQAVGFLILETKESPKVFFCICQRPNSKDNNTSLDTKWTTINRINFGKKFRNPFAIQLNKTSVEGHDLEFL